SFIEQHLGVPLHITAGATAIAAAGRLIPAGDWLWRPPAIAVTLARAGKGYRGGYQFHRRYRGPAYKYDQNRAYLSAMRVPLALRGALERVVSVRRNAQGFTFVACTGQAHYLSISLPGNLVHLPLNLSGMVIVQSLCSRCQKSGGSGPSDT